MGTLNAEYGKKEYAKKNYFSQKDGDVVFRIIPALTKFTTNPRDWAKYHSIIFGYKNTEGKVRPFQSVQVKRNKVVEVEDPAVKRITDLKEKLEQAKKEGNDALVAKLNTLVGFGGTYSIDNNYHMNVIDLQGNIGTLKIRVSAKELLDIEINKLVEKGVDPLSLENGRYFVFTRTGSGNNTAFQVNVYKEEIDHPELGRVQKDVVHKITPELLAKIEREAQDLSKVAPKITLEEVARVVASADIPTGKTAVCNEVFDNRWKAEREARSSQRQGGTNSTNNALTSSAAASPVGVTAPTATSVTNGSTTVATVSTASPPLPTTQVAAAVQALQNQTAALVQTTNTAHVPTVTVTPVSAPTAVELTHEQWLAEIGIDPNS